MPARLPHDHLHRVFFATDQPIRVLAEASAGQGLADEQPVGHETDCVRALLRTFLADEARKPLPAKDADSLAVFRALVRGDPSWNAIRDNCRELVYYRNCIELDRIDALPMAAERMAVRLARHVCLTMSTRCQREGRLMQSASARRRAQRRRSSG